MVAGSLVVGLCLLVLGWTSEIVGLFISNEQTVCLMSMLRVFILTWLKLCC